MSHTSFPNHRSDDTWMGIASQTFIWFSLAAAALLLMWFVTILQDVTQRGEERRMQQRTTGSYVLTDELQRRGGAEAGVLTAVSGAPALR